jgi:hypothetical protein
VDDYVLAAGLLLAGGLEEEGPVGELGLAEVDFVLEAAWVEEGLADAVWGYGVVYMNGFLSTPKRPLQPS